MARDEGDNRGCVYVLAVIWAGLSVTAWAFSIRAAIVASDLRSQLGDTSSFAMATRTRDLTVVVVALLSVKIGIFVCLALGASLFAFIQFFNLFSR
jgi:hypothetical protein